MKTWSTTLFAFAVLALAAQHVYTSPSSDDDGRFEGVGGSATAVWVVDRRTGKVRKCTQEFADQTPRCSGFSN